MTTNPPQDLGTELEDIKRRLKALETAPRAAFTSIKEGTLEIRDDADNLLVELGKIDTVYGIRISSDTGQEILNINNVQGHDFPRMPVVLVPSPDGGGFFTTSKAAVVTTSTSWKELYRGDFSSVGTTIRYDMIVQALTAGATLDWRIMIAEVGGTLTQAASGTGTSTASQVASTFSIPAACLISGTDPRGRSMSIRVEAQRATGSGEVFAAPTSPFLNYN